MKRIAISLIALCASLSAAQADGMTVPSVAYSARPVSCYGKVFGAGEFVTQRTDMLGVSIDSLGQNGFGIGGQVGCDVTNGLFVIGAFADYTKNQADTKLSAFGIPVLTVPFGSEYSVGARAGMYTSASTLLYGGVAYTVVEQSRVNLLGLPISLDGPRGATILGGIETTLAKNIIISLEYRHTGYQANTTAVLPMTFETTANVVRVGMGLKF